MSSESSNPPIAEQRPFTVLSPYGNRLDPYYWLRDDDRCDPDVLGYLEQENAYTDRWFEPLQSFRDTLYRELIGRLKQDDSTVPYRRAGVWYHLRYPVGGEYPIYLARVDEPGAVEQVLLDANIEAGVGGYYDVGNLVLSPNRHVLAYAEDRIGRRQYTIRLRDLASGAMFTDTIDHAEPDIAWADDGVTLFYIAKDPHTLLGNRVMRHHVGAPQHEDELVYHEEDPSFYLGLERSRSGRYLYIVLSSTVSSEVRYLSAAKPHGEFTVAIPRTADHEYQLEDLDDRFVIRSNADARNFRIVSAPIDHVADRMTWQEVVPSSETVFIDDFALLRNHLVIVERSDGLRRIRVHPWDGADDFMISAEEPTYTMSLGVNEDPDSTTLRYVYASPATPRTTYDYELLSGERVLRKRESVEGGFDSAHYRTELLWTSARDGSRIPVSLLYRSDHQHDATAPLYLYGYGAYGLSQDPGFKSSVLSLVDRGCVYAIAHVRGGEELGRRWYDEGRLLKKRHTFEDFIDVTRDLVSRRICDPDRVCASGGSAGGLLIGAIANLEPSLYRVLVAHVPFVDIVTTMLDEDIPLTTNEYDEWGNPAASMACYSYMLGYSPYDNVSARDYPALYIATGLHDSQVQYWEPAKWVARLRAVKSDRNPLLLRIDLDAGHGGKSGRFQRYREIAEEYTFVLAQVGLAGGFQSMET